MRSARSSVAGRLAGSSSIGSPLRRTYPSISDHLVGRLAVAMPETFASVLSQVEQEYITIRQLKEAQTTVKLPLLTSSFASESNLSGPTLPPDTGDGARHRSTASARPSSNSSNVSPEAKHPGSSATSAQ